MRFDPSTRARAACGLFVCLVSLAASAQDGPITIRANAEYQQGSRKFVISGETDLPDHTILGLMVYFCGEAAPGAVARGEVLAGQFKLLYGPIDRHVLSGVYDLAVRYAAFDQVPAVRKRLEDRPEEKTCRVSTYCGTRDDEKQETKWYQERLKDGLTRTRILYGDLRTRAKEYLDGKREFREADFEAWANDWRSKQKGLDTLAREVGPESIFAPRFPESVRDLAVIANFLDLLFLHYYEEICRKNGRDPARTQVLVARPAFSLMVDEYIREIERRIVEVEEREDEKREPTSFDLYRDLLDYQALFTKLLEEFDQARKSPTPAAAWAQRREAWTALVDGFAARAVRYKGSAIEKAHAEIASGLAGELAELARGLIDLDAKFGEEAGKPGAEKGNPLPASLQKAVEAIRERFQALYAIVLAEREAIVQEVEKRLQAFQALSDELEAAREKADQGGAAMGEWTAWLPGWRDRLALGREDLDSWAKASKEIFHMPNAPRLLNTLAEAMGHLADLYDATLDGRTADTTEERIKFNCDVRDGMTRQVRAEVEEARKTR